MTFFSEKVNRFINILFFASAALLVVAISVHFAFGKAIFNYSISLSQLLQQEYLGLYNFCDFLSHQLMFLFALYPSVVFLVRANKKSSFVMLTIVCIAFFVTGVSKMLFMDSRPSFENKDLKRDRAFCAKEYGNPSGHALISTAYTVGIVYDILVHTERAALKFVLAGAFSTLPFLVIFSRIFFGAHSIN